MRSKFGFHIFEGLQEWYTKLRKDRIRNVTCLMALPRLCLRIKTGRNSLSRHCGMSPRYVKTLQLVSIFAYSMHTSKPIDDGRIEGCGELHSVDAAHKPTCCSVHYLVFVLSGYLWLLHRVAGMRLAVIAL